MPNGVRNSIWAVFFLAGMAFMAALIFMLRPELFTKSGVREKPGSSLVIGGTKQQPPNEVAGPGVAARSTALPKLAIWVEHREEKVEIQTPRVTAERQPKVAEHRVEQPRLAPPAVPVTALKPNAEVVHRLTPGRSVLGHISLIGDFPPPKSLAVADRFCGPHSSATAIVSRVI